MPEIAIGDPYPDEPYPGTTYIRLPIIQPIVIPFIPYEPEPRRASTRCPRCGMEWSGIMGYVCGSTSCPMQATIT